MRAPRSVLRRNTDARDALGQTVRCPPYAEVVAWRRFGAKMVMLPASCWLWVSPPRDDGYGQFSARPDSLVTRMAGMSVEAIDQVVAGEQLELFGSDLEAGEPGPPRGTRRLERPWRAHRWSYAAHAGSNPPQELLHQCGRPLCVNPDHLRPGTPAENAKDRDAAGRLVHPGRGGVMWWGTRARRQQAEESRALHEALTEAVAAGVRPDELAAIVARVEADGTPADVTLDIRP